MNHSKEELEKLIREKKPIATYKFNENRKIFTSNVEIVLGIKKIEENLYQAQYYYLDGHEFWLNDSKLFFKGNIKEAKLKAIESWNKEPELFLNYPIIYLNISCEIDETE